MLSVSACLCSTGSWSFYIILFWTTGKWNLFPFVIPFCCLRLRTLKHKKVSTKLLCYITSSWFYNLLWNNKRSLNLHLYQCLENTSICKCLLGRHSRICRRILESYCIRILSFWHKNFIVRNFYTNHYQSWKCGLEIPFVSFFYEDTLHMYKEDYSGNYSESGGCEMSWSLCVT